MSFNVNNIAVASVYYNGSEVKSIYYNGVNVWESWSWPGWSVATWEDVYKLCKQKQSGAISAWPSDVVLGATKTTTLSSTVGSVSGMEMMIIGLDIDGPGVITLHSTGVMGSKATSANQGISGAGWNDAEAFYNACSAKPYIKQLTKMTMNSSGTLEAHNAYVWLISTAELGEAKNADEFTQGVSTAYPYYNTTTRNKGSDYWTRSIRSGYTYCYAVRNNTSASITSSSSWTAYIAPAFAIG